MQARIYRLPHGEGFFVVVTGKKAFHFEEDVNEETALATVSGKMKSKNFEGNGWHGFARDLEDFGIEGFGFGGIIKI